MLPQGLQTAKGARMGRDEASREEGQGRQRNQEGRGITIPGCQADEQPVAGGAGLAVGAEDTLKPPGSHPPPSKGNQWQSPPTAVTPSSSPCAETTSPAMKDNKPQLQIRSQDLLRKDECCY